MKNKLINYFKKCLVCGNKTFKVDNQDSCPFYGCNICCSYIYKHQSRLTIYNSFDGNVLLYSSNYFDGGLNFSTYLKIHNCKVLYLLIVEDFNKSVYDRQAAEYTFEYIKDLFKFQKKLIDYRCLE